MPAGRFDAERVAGSWTHSHEEDSEGRIVYRPSDSAFPLARRPRAALELGPDGHARQRAGPAPADRRTADDGTWELDGAQLVLRLRGRPEERYEIESVDEQRLVLRRMG